MWLSPNRGCESCENTVSLFDSWPPRCPSCPSSPPSFLHATFRGRVQKMKCSEFFFPLLVQIEQRKASKAPKNRFSKNGKRTHFSGVLLLLLLCRLLLVRLVDCTVNLSDFYSYRLIGKLTAFFQLQEFSQRHQTWELRTSTFVARLSLT